MGACSQDAELGMLVHPQRGLEPSLLSTEPLFKLDADGQPGPGPLGFLVTAPGLGVLPLAAHHSKVLLGTTDDGGAVNGLLVGGDPERIDGLGDVVAAPPTSKAAKKIVGLLGPPVDPLLPSTARTPTPRVFAVPHAIKDGDNNSLVRF